MVAKSLGLSRNDYSKAGIPYAWFLAPKTKYCLLINDYEVISAKCSFKRYSKKHRMIKLNDFISLSEGKTVLGSFLIDGTEKIEGGGKPLMVNNVV